MARPSLPIGTYGNIRTETLGANRFCARARFRDYDGKARDVEATGTTGPAAVRALKERLRDRATPNDDEITRETFVSKLAELWVDEILAEERVTLQTVDRYRTSLRTAILPAVGNLRLREATVGRLDKFLRDVARDRLSAAKGAKVVLSQMFALATRRGALTSNPVRDTGATTQATPFGGRPGHRPARRSPHGHSDVAAAHSRQAGTSPKRRPRRHRRPPACHRSPHRRDPGAPVV